MRPDQQNGVIYFVLRSDGLIKIGTTTDLRRRMWKLRSEHRGSVDVLRTMPGSYSLEHDLHQKFLNDKVRLTDQNVRRSMEVFRPSSDLMDFIERIAE